MGGYMDYIAGLDLNKQFYSGVLSTFDISGGSFEVPDWTRGLERDAVALRGDWERVGGDICRAMDSVANE